MKGGYEPSVLHGQVGEPLRLVFRREETAACSERVVFPALGRSATLPPFEDVTIELVPEHAGEYAFTCQLGVLQGRLRVRSADRPRAPVGSFDGTTEEGDSEEAGSFPRPVFALASIAGGAWSAVLALWGGFVGLAPHVLHHVGPLAGAALVAGATGRVLFAAIGFAAAIPSLRRLHRRFRTWKAPAIALGVFAAAFSISSFLIGPAISGDVPARPGVELDGHAEHH